MGRRLIEQKIAVTNNGGEDVIKIVRNAAGDLAQRFHLLRLEQLRMGALQAFGCLAVLRYLEDRG